MQAATIKINITAPNSQKRKAKRGAKENGVVVNEYVKGRFHIVEKVIPSDQA